MRMRWPGQRALETRIAELEKRADVGYTDALISALSSRASGGVTATATATAALEACAGFVARSFAAAEVEADEERITDAVTPEVMAMIGRSLIRSGEILFAISTDGGRLALHPAQTFDVDGTGDPETWTYRVTVAGPSRTRTFDAVPSSGVVHCRYAVDPERPWRGIGPAKSAELAGRLSAEVAAALTDEASGPRGSFLSIPVSGADATVTSLRADIPRAGGKMLLATGGDWDAGPSGGPALWDQRRFGAQPPDALVRLLMVATMEVYAACGLNPALFSTEGETAAREAYRQALHGVVAPLGRLVARELTVKLEGTIRFDWRELRAGDIAGRARAFQSLVGSGMAIAEAASVTGILAPEG